jgi:hypothetical protein
VVVEADIVAEARVATVVVATSKVEVEATVVAREVTVAEARVAMAAEATSKVEVEATVVAREATAEVEATKGAAPPCHLPFDSNLSSFPKPFSVGKPHGYPVSTVSLKLPVHWYPLSVPILCLPAPVRPVPCHDSSGFALLAR